LLEVGPGQTLSGLVRQQIKPAMKHSVVPGMTRGDGKSLMHALGKLWLNGAAVNWTKVYEGEQRRRVPLPTYPFERKRFWIEQREAVANVTSTPALPAPRVAPVKTIVSEQLRIMGQQLELLQRRAVATNK